MGIHEMKGSLLQEDLDSWKPLIEWLEHRPSASATATAAGGTYAAPMAIGDAGPRPGEGSI
jgi:hypothetical protein